VRAQGRRDATAAVLSPCLLLTPFVLICAGLQSDRSVHGQPYDIASSVHSGESYTSIVYLHQQLHSHFNLHLILSPTLSLSTTLLPSTCTSRVPHIHLVILIHHRSFCSRMESHLSRITDTQADWFLVHSHRLPTRGKPEYLIQVMVGNKEQVHDGSI
jgi:hypothetical protein